mmetsp:Transcript_41315/g.86688  ORF Transcript_41315/g.86688 Transcript_41315/m.86688 type:complete len:215 (+) Transcript_41315:205-849(+)
MASRSPRRLARLSWPSLPSPPDAWLLLLLSVVVVVVVRDERPAWDGLATAVATPPSSSASTTSAVAPPSMPSMLLRLAGGNPARGGGNLLCRSPLAPEDGTTSPPSMSRATSRTRYRSCSSFGNTSAMSFSRAKLPNVLRGRSDKAFFDADDDDDDDDDDALPIVLLPPGGMAGGMFGMPISHSPEWATEVAFASAYPPELLLMMGVRSATWGA